MTSSRFNSLLFFLRDIYFIPVYAFFTHVLKACAARGNVAECVTTTLNKKHLGARCLAQTLRGFSRVFLNVERGRSAVRRSVLCFGTSRQAVSRGPLGGDSELALRQLFLGAFAKLRKATVDKSMLRFEILFRTYVLVCVVRLQWIFELSNYMVGWTS